jgi:hypothetical protein
LATAGLSLVAGPTTLEKIVYNLKGIVFRYSHKFFSQNLGASLVGALGSKCIRHTRLLTIDATNVGNE